MDSQSQFWVIVIGAVFLGVTQVVSLILDYKRERDKITRDAATAREVREVKARLENTTETQGNQLASLTKTSEETHKAVNSTAKALAEQKLKDEAKIIELTEKNLRNEAKIIQLISDNEMLKK